MRFLPAPRLTTASLLVAVSTVSLHAAATAEGAPDPGQSESHLTTLEVASTTPGSLVAAAAVTLGNGGTLLGDAPGLLLVEVPEHATERLAEVVEGEVRSPIPVDVRPESTGSNPLVEAFGPTAGAQVAITNAQTWHDAGIDGTGIKVGVIDFFETVSNWDVDEHGPLPVAGANALCLDQGVDCTDEFFDGVDLGGEDHGVAVVEVIRDMAPDVEIFIGQATTLTDYHALVDWLVGNGVQIVNRSLGSRFDGPGDGRGRLDELASYAASKGLLWVNSGGNNGEDRYYRQPVRLVGDRVAFGPDGTETFLRANGSLSLGGVRWANDWDKDPADRTDYDLYLWESPTGNPAAGSVIDSSVRGQRRGADPIELLTDTPRPALGNSLYLEVRWLGGDIDGDILEILDYGGGFASYTQAAYSAAVSIVDSADRGVIAVGAIDPADGGEIGSYSSQGPTNDGRLAPDLTAPSGFSSSVYGRFAGTSAASPVVAGSAALLLDAGLASGPATLGDLIRNSALDRGEAGPDHVYGHGEFRLPPPPDPLGVDSRPARFVALDVPTRFLDTRPESSVGPTDLIGDTWPGQILELPILGVDTIPVSGATAVVANLVTVSPDRPGYLQALPTRQGSLGGYSNLNADSAGQVRANMAVIPVGDDGTISLYSTSRGHAIVDVLGWFEATAGPVNAGRFVELPTAQRVLDTRADSPVGPLASNATRTVPMPTGIDADLIDSLVVTVTSTEVTESGWVQAYPADRPDVIGTTSTINVDPGSTVANTAIVPVGSAGIAVTGKFAGSGSAQVIVDVIGYMTSEAALKLSDGRFVSIEPNRSFDSRASAEILTKVPFTVTAQDGSGATVPSGTSGVVWNLTITAAARPGYVRAWAASQPEPATSSLNWTLPGETRASAAITAVSGGLAQVVAHDGQSGLPEPIGHLIADVFGYFT